LQGSAVEQLPNCTICTRSPTPEFWHLLQTFGVALRAHGDNLL
jgi:hypothetical protein